MLMAGERACQLFLSSVGKLVGIRTTPLAKMISYTLFGKKRDTIHLKFSNLLPVRRSRSRSSTNTPTCHKVNYCNKPHENDDMKPLRTRRYKCIRSLPSPFATRGDALIDKVRSCTATYLVPFKDCTDSCYENTSAAVDNLLFSPPRATRKPTPGVPYGRKP